MESIDLSGLPDALRKKVQEQLDRLPPEQRKQFLAKAGPMLNKARETVKQVDAGALRKEAREQIERLKPHGHYNSTIRPGDSGGFTLLRWIGFFLLAIGVYKIFD